MFLFIQSSYFLLDLYSIFDINSRIIEYTREQSYNLKLGNEEGRAYNKKI